MPMACGSEIERLIRAAIPDARGDDHATSPATATIMPRGSSAPSFAGLSRVRQHQAVYAALGGRMGGELHALQLETAAPPGDDQVSDAQQRIDEHRQEQRRGAVHEGHGAVPAMRLFQPRGGDPRPSRRANIETVDVLQDPEIRQGIKEYSDWPTIPQLYVQGRIRRRIGHHDGDVRERRAAAAGRSRRPSSSGPKRKGAVSGTRNRSHRPFRLAWNQVDAIYCSNRRANSEKWQISANF